MEPTFLDGAITDEEPASKRAKSSPPLRVCGVPEHFNLPWQLGIERQIFEQHGVNVVWVTEGNGTGAMIKQLKDGNVDIIVALTEGLVTEISRGSDIRLLGTYVNSPLVWAVSAAGKKSKSFGKIKSIADLKDGTIGVSRLLSGSHLMASVMASERGWDPEQLTYEKKGKFQPLRDGVNDGSTDAFMWETFTTKPFHDSGELSRVGDVATPWPCFMLAARTTVVDDRLDDIQRCLAGIHKVARTFHTELNMSAMVANRYELKAEDAAAWYSTVDISAERFVSEAALERVILTLKQAKAIDTGNPIKPIDVLEPRLAELRRDIKSMKLYNKPELKTALHRRLRAAGLQSGQVSYKEFTPYDQHHYHGATAVDELVAKVKITNSARVINVGSGLGGPARYLAGSTGCQVLACELQNDLHMSASELTERCNLATQVDHVAGDFLSLGAHLQLGAYDFVVSWLTILHINDRATLFKRAYDCLKPGGTFFAADFFQVGQLTEDEREILKNDVACPTLCSSAAGYKAELELAGFRVSEVDDCTADWKVFTDERVKAFEKDKVTMSQVLGKDIYDSLLHFYTVVRDLYAAGNLGGIKIYATKPLGW